MIHNPPMHSGRFAAVLIGFGAVIASAQTPPYDIVITGGTLIDGTGQPPRRADVAIVKGRIASIGKIPGARGLEAIDAGGLVVAPGFIDVHTHADRLVERPFAENFVRMGVTTVVAGNCGSSALDIDE